MKYDCLHNVETTACIETVLFLQNALLFLYHIDFLHPLIISASLNIFTELRRQLEDKQDELNSKTTDLEGLIADPERSKHTVIHSDHLGLC